MSIFIYWCITLSVKVKYYYYDTFFSFRLRALYKGPVLSVTMISSIVLNSRSSFEFKGINIFVSIKNYSKNLKCEIKRELMKKACNLNGFLSYNTKNLELIIRL